MTTALRSPPLHGLWAFSALIKIAIFLAAGRSYGFMADELYFLDAAQRLAAGYVDFSPAIAWILAGVTNVFGSDLLVLRGLACLTGIGVTILAIDITRLLGGKSTAQWIAAIVVLFAPAFLSVQSIMTMNVFDQLWWALGFWLLIRYLQDRTPAYMIWLGVVFGLALLTKLSIGAWFASLAIATLIYARETLKATEVWIATGLMLLISAPFFAWQIDNGWPFIEFIRAYNANPPEAMVIDHPIFGLITTMNPPFLLVWLPGLIYGFMARDPVARLLGSAAGMCLALFLLLGVKFYFATPLFILFAALGAILWERWLEKRLRVRALVIGSLAVSGVMSIPIAAPVLPASVLQQLADFIRDGEQGHQGTAPAPVGRYFPHFAEMHGWPELVATVTEHYLAIEPEIRPRVSVVAAYFGQAGALNQLDTEDRLPEAYSGHVNYHRWSEGAQLADVLFVGFDKNEIEALYADVSVVGRFYCERCMARENGLYILRARNPAVDSSVIRGQIRRFYFF